MNKKIIFITIVFCCLFGKVFSQVCGTTISPKQIEELEQMLQQNSLNSNGIVKRTSNVLVNIPVKFHVFRRSDGSGGMTQQQADDLLIQVNDYYISANMQFVHQGEINFVEDDNVFDFNADSEGEATVGNTVPGVVNLYFFNSIRLGGSQLCGYTRFPPSADRVFNVNSCVLNGNTTLEHELGHYFTLYHTHGTTNTGTTDELVDQSNCIVAGDRICDTAADPNLTGVVNTNCAYVGTATDANGDQFKPDPSNIMSYSTAACRDSFTQGQFQRIRSGFENGRGYLNYTSDSFLATFSTEFRDVCVGESASFNLNSFGATSYEWEFPGGEPSTSTLQSPSVLYNSSGNFPVTLTVFNNAGQTFTVVRDSYIRVKNPLLNSIENDLVASFDDESDIISNFNITNADNSLTFELTNLNLNNSSEGAIFVDNFNYITESLPQIDELSTLSFNNEGIRKYNIEFEYAYSFRSIGSGLSTQIIVDSLYVLVGNECDNKFNTIFKNGGQGLATIDEAMEGAFIPNSNNEFKKIQLEYIPDNNENFSLFKFRNISYNGNNLYIKNLNIFPDFNVEIPTNFRFVGVDNNNLVFRWIDNSTNETSFTLEASVDGNSFEKVYEISNDNQIFNLPITEVGQFSFFRLKAVGVKGFESDYTEIIQIPLNILSNSQKMTNIISIFPNPSQNIFHIKSETGIKIERINIYTINGRRLKSYKNIDSDNFNIDFADKEDGIYFIEIQQSQNNFIRKFKILKN